MSDILALGDSVLLGIVSRNNRFVACENSFVHIIEQKLSVTIENKSRLGATIKYGKAFANKSNIDETLNKTVFLEFGGNDCDFNWEDVALTPSGFHNPNTTLDDFHSEYVALINRIQSIGGTPFLLSLPPIVPHRYLSLLSSKYNREDLLKWAEGDIDFLKHWHEIYNIEVFKIARECDVPIYDITTCFYEKKHYESFISSDGIHPNEEGHKMIANKILSYY